MAAHKEISMGLYRAIWRIINWDPRYKQHFGLSWQLTCLSKLAMDVNMLALSTIWVLLKIGYSTQKLCVFRTSLSLQTITIWGAYMYSTQFTPRSQTAKFVDPQRPQQWGASALYSFVTTFCLQHAMARTLGWLHFVHVLCHASGSDLHDLSLGTRDKCAVSFDIKYELNKLYTGCGVYDIHHGIPWYSINMDDLFLGSLGIP
jgi:hypothetical protein